MSYRVMSDEWAFFFSPKQPPNFWCFLFQSSNFQFLLMQDFVRTPLRVAVKATENNAFFFFLISKLKEKGKKKKKFHRSPSLEIFFFLENPLLLKSKQRNIERPKSLM